MPLLKYGQVIRSLETPLSVTFIDSHTVIRPQAVGEFFISKYDEGDDSPEFYKVLLIPTQQYKPYFPMIVYKSSELIRKIEEGKATIISES